MKKEIAPNHLYSSRPKKLTTAELKNLRDKWDKIFGRSTVFTTLIAFINIWLPPWGLGLVIGSVFVHIFIFLRFRKWSQKYYKQKWNEYF